MNKKIVITLVVFFSIISVTSIVLGVYQPWKSKDTEIEFTHNETLSYPNQKTWIVARFFCDVDGLMDVSVNTNQSIDMDYTVREGLNMYYFVDIFLYPNQTHLNKTILVTLSVTIGDHVTQKTSIVNVIDWTGNLTSEVEEILDCFSSYLIENFTSFDQAENDTLEFMGITPQILVVSHYLFRTDNWELCISRHVTIAPHDWVQIYLRSRDSFLPSWAWTIDSWSSLNHTIYMIEPPESIYR
ncbi:MAG: hypothetical protein FK733_08200 [Asgard group archaeon]|nr:hypothetical protein [Asgard group archaeon]